VQWFRTFGIKEREDLALLRNKVALYCQPREWSTLIIASTTTNERHIINWPNKNNKPKKAKEKQIEKE